jgi:hypothetical protein
MLRSAMAEQEQTTNKIPMATRVDPNISAAIDKIVAEEDRTLSNTIERLLKTHPRVQEILEAEAAGVSA